MRLSGRLLRNLDGLQLVALLDGIHHVLTGFHAAEHGVLPVQPSCFHMGDEELAAIGAGTGVGHGKGARRVFQVTFAFVSELVARAACAGALWATALHHEVGDDAMEGGAVIKAVLREEDEIVNGIRTIGGEQFAHNIAAGCFKRGRVGLRRIDYHVGLF